MPEISDDVSGWVSYEFVCIAKAKGLGRLWVLDMLIYHSIEGNIVFMKEVAYFIRNAESHRLSNYLLMAWIIEIGDAIA